MWLRRHRIRSSALIVFQLFCFDEKTKSFSGTFSFEDSLAKKKILIAKDSLKKENNWTRSHKEIFGVNLRCCEIEADYDHMTALNISEVLS